MLTLVRHRAIAVVALACTLAGSLAGGWHAHPHGPGNGGDCCHVEVEADHSHRDDAGHHDDPGCHAEHGCGVPEVAHHEQHSGERHPASSLPAGEPGCVVCVFLAQCALPIVFEAATGPPLSVAELAIPDPPARPARDIFSSARPRAPPASV
ncbi:MAG: hypothetical protein WD403_08425 [Pirellulales bacterium]